MKKKIVLAASCLAVAFLSPLYGKEETLGYVDMQEVFQCYHKAQKSEEILKSEVADEQKKINALQEEVKQMRDAFEKKKDLLKPDERKKQEESLREKITELSTLLREANTKLDRRRKELEDARLQEIVDVVREYGKKNGYRVILDSRAVIYGAEAANLTTEIIKLVNQKN